MRRRPGSLTGAAALVTTVVLSMLLGLAGCSGDDEKEPDREGAPGSTSTDPGSGLATRVEVGAVVGKLGKGPARKLAAQVAGVVDEWLEAAYVGGDYPRSDFGDAFPGFTKDAAGLASREKGLMSNAGIGGDIDAVTATRRAVRVDLLAPKGKAAGATAHVNLVIEITGEIERTDQIRGRVVLTPSQDGWRIFGFDIERGRARG